MMWHLKTLVIILLSILNFHFLILLKARPSIFEASVKLKGKQFVKKIEMIREKERTFFYLAGTFFNLSIRSRK